MTDKQLFRKQALERFASPEQVDQALSVTSSHGWLALAAILMAFTAVVGWSFVGRVSTYVQGNAILLNRGGSVVDAVAAGPVRLDAFKVSVGDAVAEGQIVAVGFNDTIAERVAGAQELVIELNQALEDEQAAVAEESRIARTNDARELQRLDEIEASARVSVETVQSIFDDNSRLFDEGVVSRLVLERSREDLNRARRELLAVLRERDSLDAVGSRREHTNAARIREAVARMQAAQRQVRELNVQMNANRIVAPVAGRVTEIKAATGTLLAPGQPVLSIRSGNEQLEVLIYIAPTEGPNVEPGMEVLVSPITVRREEFGAIRGIVENLSQFPVSMDGIVAELQNPELARMFSEDGSPYSGRVSLLSDPMTASGFAWTSPKAANETLTSGTLAMVEIRTDAQPPITLVIPAIRELLGL